MGGFNIGSKTNSSFRKTSVLALAILFSSPFHGSAQNNRAAAANENWNANVAQQNLDAERIKVVEVVDSYFKQLESLHGTFVQTNPDNQTIAGKFYVQRPGKMRFDYKRPSRLRIVADGKWLAIEDPDTNTFDRYQLKSTPFRMLLRRDVNLLRDARVLDHAIGDNIVILTLADRSRNAGGQIKLFFTITPEFQLKEWIVTDAQGLDTRIQVADLVSGEKINPRLFRVTPLKFPEISE